LLVAFTVTVAWEAGRYIASYQGSRHWALVLIGSGGFLLGLTTAVLMYVAAVMLTIYCSDTAISVQPRASHNVYDDISLSQARIFLPAKARPNISDSAVVSSLLAAATAAGSGDSSALLRSGRLPERPGDAGRWLLPDADGEWDDWADLVGGVRSMADLWTAYTTLQGVILVLLIFR
jgi:hypothetical protein